MKTKAYLLITFLFAFVFAKAQIDQSVVTCAKGTALGTNSYSIAITDSKCFIPPLEKDGIEIGMMPAISNTGASTLKLNGWTARSIKKNGSALVSGDLVANVYYIAKYNSTTSCWDIIGGSSSGAEPAITPGTTAQYWRGDKTWQTLDKTAVGLSNVPNVDATARANHTGTQTASTISDFTSSARSSISLTTTGTSGVATYNSGTGVLNVPNYSGTVTNFTATDANGIVWNINTPTTTPNITATLTNITPSTVNGNTIQNGTGTLKLNTYQLEAIADNKVLNSTNATHLDAGSAGSIPYQSNPGATTYLAPGTNGQVITWLSGVPTNTTLTTGGSGSVTSVGISGGTTGLTFSGGPITTAGTFTTSGTLAIANGGTGQTNANAAFNALSPNTTRGDISVRNATVNARLALGAAGTILRSDGTDLAYSTATYPNTTTANQILYSSATNTIGGSPNLTYDGTTFSTPVASHSTSLTSPLIIGGSGTTQSLTYKTTTGVGTTGADHIFTSGNNGATEIARMTNAGAFLVGKTATTVGEIVAFKKDYAGPTLCVGENANASGAVTYRLNGNQKTVELGLYNSGHSSYGMIAANDAYMYGNANFSFMAEGASSVIKWSTGSSTLEKMRLDASGRLGIGTTSPASQLDVEGGVAIGATYSGTTAAPTNGLTVEGSVGIGTATVTTTNKVQIASTGGGASTSHTGVQYTGTQSGASSVLYGIRSDVSGGEVTYAVRGSNTNTQASSNNHGARFNATGVGGTSNTGVDAEASGATTNIGLNVTSSSNTDYGIKITSEDYALVTVGSAKVGIGTTTPASQLDVEGGVAIGATYSGTTAAPTNGLIVQGDAAIGATSTNAKLQVTDANRSGNGAAISATLTNTVSVSSNIGINSIVSTTGSSTNNFALRGVVSGATTNYGVFGEAINSATANYGGYFSAQGATNNYGLVVLAGSVGIGTDTPTELFQVSGTETVSITSDGKIIQNGLITYNKLVSVADDGTFDIPAGTTGWCEVIAGVSSTIDGAIAFRFTNDGAVVETRVADAIASSTTDTDTKLCAFDNGSNVRIKNRLGGTRDLLIKLTYR